MKPRLLGVVALVLALIGLGASIASLVAYFGPAFCSDSGCESVRNSAWAHPAGIPMPILGIAYFATMIALGFWSNGRARLGCAIGGGVWAIGLVALQAFVIHAWCKLCLVVDPITILLALVVIAGAGTIRPTLRRGLLLAPALVAILVALHFYTHTSAPTGIPEIVLREQVAGEITIVEFVDFECPFCRAMQRTLAEAITGEPVRIVRKMVPLPQHEHALPAAIAWCCANAQGKGEAMAAALFATDPAQLTADHCEQLAARVGCDLDRYRRDAPAMIGRVAADMLDARGAGIRSLPTIFIGTERITGAKYTAGELVALLHRGR